MTRRSTIGATLAVMTLLLTACSESGTSAGTTVAVATPSSAASPTAAADTSGATSESSSSAPVVSGTTSSRLSSRSSASAPSTPKPSGTASVGSFDLNTAQFFAGLCSGLQNKPKDKVDTLPTDFTSRRTAAAQLFSTQAEGFTNAVATMKAAGTPKIPDGAQLASVVLATYPKIGAAAAAGAKQVAAASSAAALEKVFDAARNATDQAAAPLQDVSEIIGAPAVVAQLQKIPACAGVING